LRTKETKFEDLVTLTKNGITRVKQLCMKLMSDTLLQCRVYLMKSVKC